MSTLSPSTRAIMPSHTRSRVWCRDHTGRKYTYDQATGLIRKFHGHTAPGLIIGTKMVTLAMDCLPKDTIFDAVCETTSCLPDAVQMLTPCTVGNGWLRIQDLGRYAVILYSKREGNGFRVAIDPAKLKKWPEFYAWFFKRKAKKDQDFNRLLKEIHAAGETVLNVRAVAIKPSYLVRRSKGAIGTCVQCGEAFPLAHGSSCRGCQGQAPCETK